MNCFRSLKMKEQIIIVDVLIMSVILLAITGTYFIQKTILFDFIQSSTEQITMKQEKRQLELTSLKISNFLEEKYDRCNNSFIVAILNIKHIEQFFQYSQFNKDRYTVSNQLFQACVKKEDIENQKIIFNSNLFCYQTFINQVEITSTFNQTASLLSQFSLLFDATADVQLVIGNLPDADIMISYPLMFQLADFNVKTRPWFITYQSMYETNPHEQYYYTPVYLSLFTLEEVRALVATIYDVYGSPIGYIRNTILLRDEQLSKVPMNILLVNNDGGIVFSSFMTPQQTYIYDQTITGFNNSDWEQIQQYTDNEHSDQLCNGHSNTFCLYNKLYNASVQIETLQFKKEQLNLIIFTNVTFEAELVQEFNSLTNNLLSLFVIIEQVLMISCLILLILTGICVHFMFVPLFQLMENVKKHIRSIGNNLNKEIFKMVNSRKKPGNVFSNLNVRFMTLHDLLSKSQIQKCKLCLEIEQIQYNIKAPDMDYCNMSQYVSYIEESPDKKQPLFQHRSNRSVNICELINNTLQEQYCNNHHKD